jgi:hypothetical protein
MIDREDEEYEERLRLRLGLLKDEMAAGRVVFGPDIAPSIEESLRAVRYAKDGQINLATVDGRVRSLALAVEAGKQRRDLKSVISLPDLHERYFEVIEKNFGHLHRQMVKAKVTPHQVAKKVSEDTEAVRHIAVVVPPFLEWIEGLWGEAHDVARTHVEDIGSFKAIFGGELFPTSSHSLASTCGVYVDTEPVPEICTGR